jgi:hypothetical protein
MKRAIEARVDTRKRTGNDHAPWGRMKRGRDFKPVTLSWYRLALFRGCWNAMKPGRNRNPATLRQTPELGLIQKALESRKSLPDNG